MADLTAILSKLYSGSTLTAAEKAAIGIGPAVAPTPEPVVDSRAALAKLTSGQTLTDAEKKILNIAPTPEPAPAPAPEDNTGASAPYVKGSKEFGGKVYATAAGAYAAAVRAAEQAGPPSPASPGTHWTLIGTEWKLYKDFAPAGSNTGGNTGNTGGAGGTGGTTGTTGSTTGTSNAPSQSAKDTVTSFLNEAGLGNLASQVWNQWTSGQSADQIIEWVRSTPEYAARFPAMSTLRKDGRSISEAQYVAKEQADIDLMKQYGIPDPIATDKKLLGNLIANNVSQVTLQKRLIAGQDTVLGFDNQIRQYAKDTYGLGDGALLAWVLNPDIALPVLEQQAQAMRIGGAALTSGYDRGLGAQGELGKTQAEALAAQGISQQQAQQGFTQLAQMGQLEQQLPGDVSGQLTSQEMIDAIFGISGEAQQKLGKVKQTRVGEFQQGGNFAAAQSGIVGIGQAPQV